MFDIFAYSEIKSVSADFRIKRNGEVLLINADDGFLELKMLSPDIRKKFTLPQELSERLKKYFIHLATGESFYFLERCSRLGKAVYRVTGSADNNILHISASRINVDNDELYTESSGYTFFSTAAFCAFSCKDANNIQLSWANNNFLALSEDDKHLIFTITHSSVFLYTMEELHSSCGEIECLLSGKKCKFVLSCLPLISSGRIEMIYVSIMRIDKRFYSERNGLDKLTPREREITLLAAEGFSNRYIARQLNISEGTVKKNLYNSYKKLKISSRFDAAKMI